MNRPRQALRPGHPDHGASLPGRPAGVRRSLELLVQYDYGAGDYRASKAKATEIDLELLGRFEAKRIEFALPTQELRLSGAPDGPDDACTSDDDERASDHAPRGVVERGARTADGRSPAEDPT